MTGYKTTQSGLSFLLETIRQYQSPAFFFYAACALLAVAAVLGGKRMRAAFFWPALLLAATVFNPYVFPLFLGRRADLVEHYYNALWLLPVPLILSAGICAAVFRVRHTAAKVILVAVALSAVLLSGTPDARSYEGIVLPANFMKADAELVTICDYIADCALTDEPCVAFERADFAEEAMACAPAFRISGALTGETPAPPASGMEEDFFVIRKESSELIRQLREAGYRAIAHTPDSYVFALRS